MSQAVVDLAQHARVHFSEIGPVELKGVASPLVLYSVGDQRSREAAADSGEPR